MTGPRIVNRIKERQAEIRYELASLETERIQLLQTIQMQQEHIIAVPLCPVDWDGAVT